MTTKITLPPIRKTAFYRNGRGRLECWEAESADGQWHFIRTEDVGTPWLIYRDVHASDGEPMAFCGTLRSARMWAATQ